MDKEHRQEAKTETPAEDPLEAEAKGYKTLKTSRWRPAGNQEDPNAPVKWIPTQNSRISFPRSG